LTKNKQKVRFFDFAACVFPIPPSYRLFVCCAGRCLELTDSLRGTNTELESLAERVAQFNKQQQMLVDAFSACLAEGSAVSSSSPSDAQQVNALDAEREAEQSVLRRLNLDHSTAGELSGDANPSDGHLALALFQHFHRLSGIPSDDLTSTSELSSASSANSSVNPPQWMSDSLAALAHQAFRLLSRHSHLGQCIRDLRVQMQVDREAAAHQHQRALADLQASLQHQHDDEIQQVCLFHSLIVFAKVDS
jgi:hypothetical protein